MTKSKSNYKTGSATPEVMAIGKMSFVGNIIPNEWYDKIKLESGKPDMVAIIILSEIVYWYRPTEVRSEKGNDYRYDKKFESDILRKSYNDLSDKFGFSTKQIREALKRLESMGVAERVFRTLTMGKTPIPNVMFIKIFPEQILKLSDATEDQTHPSLEGNTPITEEGYPSPKGNISDLQGNDCDYRKGKTNIQRLHSKISSKTTEEGNPPKPASSPLASAIHPSPHPAAAALALSTEPTQQPKEVTQSGESLAAVTVDPTISGVDGLATVTNGRSPLNANEGVTAEPEALGEENRSPLTSESVDGEPGKLTGEITSSLKAEKTVEAATQTETSSETQAETDEIDAIIHKRSKIQNGYDSSAKCDQKFDVIYPSGDWGYANGRYLRSTEGQVLLRLLAKYGVAIERWEEFLWYWADASNFANWRSQAGYNQKTKVEQFNNIKNAVKRLANDPERLDDLSGSVEGFVSRLRLAEHNKLRRQQQPVPVQPVDDGRRQWSREEIESRLAAAKQAQLESQEEGAIAG